jgi:hypothetical protein
MAYTQKAGRGNGLKTGGNLPKRFIQGDPITNFGIGINPDTNEAFAKPYEKKWNAPTKENPKAFITDSNNKTVKMATKLKDIAALRNEFVKDSTMTMRSRQQTANVYNAGIAGNVNNAITRVSADKKLQSKLKLKPKV